MDGAKGLIASSSSLLCRLAHLSDTPRSLHCLCILIRLRLSQSASPINSVQQGLSQVPPSVLYGSQEVDVTVRQAASSPTSLTKVEG
jgi:hypothetical protein